MKQMLEEKADKRTILSFAIYGIDTAIIEAAKLLSEDREAYSDLGIKITQLSDIRKQVGAELKAMDAENQ
ncbi:MAG: hypothetical protein K5705_06165 [Oscillospiraceae bacterium]|nr:hypothetical protein [Oscillospiraceae bacterium]